MYSFEPLGEDEISATYRLHASTGGVRQSVSGIVAMGTSISIIREIDTLN